MFLLPNSISAEAFLASLEDWHDCLGHPNYSIVRHLIRRFQLPCSSNKMVPHKYEACCLGKLHHASLNLTFHHSKAPLALIHLDV